MGKKTPCFQAQDSYLNTMFHEGKEMCTAIPSFLHRNSTENAVASFHMDFSTWNKLETLQFSQWFVPAPVQ